MHLEVDFEELGLFEPEKSFDSGEDVSFILNSQYTFKS
jgi:hypothetical protein